MRYLDETFVHKKLLSSLMPGHCVFSAVHQVSKHEEEVASAKQALQDQVRSISVRAWCFLQCRNGWIQCLLMWTVSTCVVLDNMQVMTPLVTLL